MKKLRIIIIGLISLAVLGLVGFNLYYFVWKSYKLKLQKQGFDVAIQEMVKRVNATGQVQLTKDIILIKKEVKKDEQQK